LACINGRKHAQTCVKSRSR